MRAKISDLTGANHNLADQINKVLGNGDADLDGGEALRTIGLASKHPGLKRVLESSFGAVPKTPAEMIEALVKTPRRGAPSADSMHRALSEALGTLGQARPIGALDGKLVTLDPDGHFSFAGQDHAPLADCIYTAARLVAPEPSALGSLELATRQKLTKSLVAYAHNSLADEANGHFQSSTRRVRHGAAALLVAIAKENGFPQKEIDALLDLAGEEKHRGLLTYVYTHLKKLEPQLTRAQATRLSALAARVLPETPPYEEWFAKGNKDLGVRHYVHPDYWDLWVGEYRRLGFTEERQNGALVFTKQYRDESGAQQPTTFRVVVRKTEEDTFRDMGDSKTQIEWYSGHSNLGGNVENALRHGPAEQSGAKWILHWMCRGEQLVSDVMRRFPDAHYTTTTIPPDGNTGQLMIDVAFQGIANRARYDQIRDKLESQDSNPKRTYMFPNDARLLELVDYDGDGVSDSGPAALDPLQDAVLDTPGSDKTDLKMRAFDGDPSAIHGEKILHGVNFANTIFYYHHKYAQGGRELIDTKYADKIISGGWFSDASDTPIRVREQKTGSTTSYVVQVNARLADQTPDSIGALVQYEFFKWAAEQKSGGRPLTDEQKAAGLLFAGEYLSYMYCTGEEAEAVMRSLSKRSGSDIGFAEVSAALDKDHSGYVTSQQVSALQQLMRPRIG